MTQKVLITGGAGFIGTHLARSLHESAEIVVLDNLLPQVHAENHSFPKSLLDRADCYRGDVRDLEIWNAIRDRHSDISAVVHLAALTGTAQSMYAIKEYDSVNCGGTATMLEALLSRRNGRAAFPNLQQVVLASSRAIYGEGSYVCDCSPSLLRYPAQRTTEQLERRRWGFYCPDCDAEMTPVPTPEIAPPQPTSFYGVTKLVQEQYVRTMLKTAGLKPTILRFQNVYGPGQSLNNPYTGVIGVFYSNITAGKAINVYEDGEVTRDFVYVTDVVSAIQSAIELQKPGEFNIGTGDFTRLLDVATTLTSIINRSVPIECNGTYRVGDIRHNAADIHRAEVELNYRPSVPISDGLRRYVEWATEQTPLAESAIVAAAEEARAAGFAGQGEG